MAQTEEQKLQASLFGELEKNNVKLAGDDAAKVKENVLKAREGGNFLGLGIHDVFIESVELLKAESGSLGIKCNVESEDGKNNAVFWLSEKALPYTIENISRLVVHNTPEDKKDAARNFIANITSAKAIFEVAKEKLVGGVGVLVVTESKTRTWTNTTTGEVKPSLETNLQTWKPKADAQQAAVAAVGGGGVIDEKTKLQLPF